MSGIDYPPVELKYGIICTGNASRQSGYFRIKPHTEEGLFFQYVLKDFF